MLPTLWNQFDEKEGNTLAQAMESGPLIFGMRLKVTTFNCKSLTTRATSGFMINPPVTDALKMQEWYNDNKDELQQLLEEKSYKNSDMLLPYPKDRYIISVAELVASLRTLKTSWIKGTTSLPRQDRSTWYTACANCQKAIDADISWIVTCPSCRLESEVEAISRLSIRIDDGTASICATICTPDAEKLMPFTGIQLKEAEENGIDLHDDIAMAVQEHTIVAFIRMYETTFHGQSDIKMNVVKCYLSDEVLSLPNLTNSPTQEKLSESPMDVSTPTTTSLTKPSVSKSNIEVAKPSTCKGKEQLFSPNTKLVIEEIGKAVTSKAVKRSLHFPNQDLHCETVAPITKPGGPMASIKKEVRAQVTKKLVADARVTDGTDGSPTKKTKDC